MFVFKSWHFHAHAAMPLHRVHMSMLLPSGRFEGGGGRLYPLCCFLPPSYMRWVRWGDAASHDCHVPLGRFR